MLAKCNASFGSLTMENSSSRSVMSPSIHVMFYKRFFIHADAPLQNKHPAFIHFLVLHLFRVKHQSAQSEIFILEFRMEKSWNNEHLCFRFNSILVMASVHESSPLLLSQRNRKLITNEKALATQGEKYWRKTNWSPCDFFLQQSD